MESINILSVTGFTHFEDMNGVYKPSGDFSGAVRYTKGRFTLQYANFQNQDDTANADRWHLMDGGRVIGFACAEPVLGEGQDRGRWRIMFEDNWTECPAAWAESSDIEEEVIIQTGSTLQREGFTDPTRYAAEDQLCLDILNKYPRVGWHGLCLAPEHADQVVQEVTARLSHPLRFADADFPPFDECVSKSADLRPSNYTRWYRPQSLVATPQLFSDGAAAGDVIQGSLGDCWLLMSIASVVGMRPEQIETLFTPRTFNPAGIYAVKLFNWAERKWMSVIIDDYLPAGENMELIFARMPQGEFWCSLLEKTFAKINTEYSSLDGDLTFLTSCTALSAMTGDSKYGFIDWEPTNEGEEAKQIRDEIQKNGGAGVIKRMQDIFDKGRW